jgi:hypothetical protein
MITVSLPDLKERLLVKTILSHKRLFVWLIDLRLYFNATYRDVKYITSYFILTAAWIVETH